MKALAFTYLRIVQIVEAFPLLEQSREIKSERGFPLGSAARL
jgi:hypothetical protein